MQAHPRVNINFARVKKKFQIPRREHTIEWRNRERRERKTRKLDDTHNRQSVKHFSPLYLSVKAVLPEIEDPFPLF